MSTGEKFPWQQLYNHVPISTASFSFRALSANLARTTRCNHDIGMLVGLPYYSLLTPLYLYRQTKNYIDSSFNRRLFRLLIMLPPHPSQSPLPSNYSCTSHRLIRLVLSLLIDFTTFYLQFKLFPWWWVTMCWCIESCSVASLYVLRRGPPHGDENSELPEVCRSLNLKPEYQFSSAL